MNQSKVATSTALRLRAVHTSSTYRVNRTAHLHSNMPVPMHHNSAPAFSCFFGERIFRSPTFAEPEPPVREFAAVHAPTRMLK